MLDFTDTEVITKKASANRGKAFEKLLPAIRNNTKKLHSTYFFVMTFVSVKWNTKTQCIDFYLNQSFK